MKIKIDLSKETRAILKEMAGEKSGLTPNFLIEVAIHNLIALWMKDRGKITPMDAADDASLVSPIPPRDS